MSVHVSKTEFKARALEFFRQVEAGGESVVVTDHGQPKVEIRPYRPRARAPLDVLRGTVLRYDAPFEPISETDWDAQT